MHKSIADEYIQLERNVSKKFREMIPQTSEEKKQWSADYKLAIAAVYDQFKRELKDRYCPIVIKSDVVWKYATEEHTNQHDVEKLYIKYCSMIKEATKY